MIDAAIESILIALALVLLEGIELSTSPLPRAKLAARYVGAAPERPR